MHPPSVDIELPRRSSHYLCKPRSALEQPGGNPFQRFQLNRIAVASPAMAA